MEKTQFDTVYHEHYSYFHSRGGRIFDAAGLRLLDVESLKTHGGSLPLYGCHAADLARLPQVRSGGLLAGGGKTGPAFARPLFRAFQTRADRIKDDFLRFLLEQKKHGKKLFAGYGAAAKGNTLLNYAGVKPDLLPYVCDASPAKQGKFLPGSHIPIVPTSALREREARHRARSSVEHRQRGSGAARLRARLGRAIRHRRSQAVRYSMKVLVTGATGFIGRHVVPQLLERGHSVVAVARDAAKASGFSWFEHVRFVACDIHSRLESPWTLFDRPDAAIHLAWPGLPNYKALFHFTENLPADFRFLSSLVEGGLARLLVTGTCFEYGMQNGCLAEDDPAATVEPLRHRQGHAAQVPAKPAARTTFRVAMGTFVLCVRSGAESRQPPRAARSGDRQWRARVQHVHWRAAAGLPSR